MIPENSGEWGVSFIPMAHVKADFLLYNTTNQKVNLQLGFPFLNPEIDKNPQKMNFRVESNGHAYQAELKKGLIRKSLDPTGQFKEVFVWKNHFEPQALNHLLVSYDVPLSITSLFMNKLATRGYAYIFSYITKTAYTWSPPVEKAVFKINLNPLISQLPAYREKHNQQKKPSYGELYYLQYAMEGVFFKGVLSLTYKDKVPEDGIYCMINVVPLPPTLVQMKDYLKDLPATYEKLSKTLLEKPYNETESLTTLLNFYKALYQGKITPALWAEVVEVTDFDRPIIEQEKLKKFLKKEYKVNFLLEGDRGQVALIIDYLEEKLTVKKPR